MQQTADSRRPKTRPLREDVRDATRRHVLEVGELSASDALGVSRHALARALAGLDVRLTVATTIEANLSRLGLIAA